MNNDQLTLTPLCSAVISSPTSAMAEGNLEISHEFPTPNEFHVEPATLRVLVIDDDHRSTTHMASGLKKQGCHVTVASTADVAVACLRDQPYDVAFCDIHPDKHDNLRLLSRLVAANPNVHLVAMTTQSSMESVISAVKAGAGDYLSKPFDQQQVNDILSKVRKQREARVHLRRNNCRGECGELSTSSQAMCAAIDTISRAALSDVPVVLRGENGTGKSILAHALHLGSERRAGPFITVNCPSLSNELMTSELFGHVKGSFTGAVSDQKGKVEVAEGGTLFLDELGDLSAAVQAKLLRFLQEQRYERLGDTRTRQADVRIVAATNQNLEEMVADGRFRQDLLYRLNVIEITLPPLRERREDILGLATSMLAEFSAAHGAPSYELSPAARSLLQSYSWPGNVRELRNELERVTVLWPSQIIEPEAFSPRLRGETDHSPVLGGDFSIAAVEAAHIRKVLTRIGAFTSAADVLGIESSTLWRKRQQLGL